MGIPDTLLLQVTVGDRIGWTGDVQGGPMLRG